MQTTKFHSDAAFVVNCHTDHTRSLGWYLKA